MKTNGFNITQLAKAKVSTSGRKWSQLYEGNLTVPYIIYEKSFTESEKTRLRETLKTIDLSGDLGCIRLTEIPNSKASEINNGVVFVKTDSGCYSALGTAPGNELTRIQKFT